MNYGFLKIDAFTSNVQDVINPVGEISLKGMSFAKEPMKYSNTAGAVVVFVTTLPLETWEAISTSLAGMTKGVNDLRSSAVRVDDLLGSAATNITVAADVINPVDGYMYPGRIDFDYMVNSVKEPVRIWLVDSLLVEEYDHATFEVIPPVDDTRMFYLNFPQAVVEMGKLLPTTLPDRIPNYVVGAVTSYLTITLRLYNVDDAQVWTDVPFMVGYNGGKRGATIRSAIIAIGEYLLNHSNLPWDDWTLIMPELVPYDVFHIVPTWGNVAVDNSALASPLYTPTIALPQTSDAFMAEYFSDLLDAGAFATYSMMLYKSLGFFAVPSLENDEGAKNWLDTFPDYMVLSVNDLNVLQVTQHTQRVIRLLEEVTRVAESYVNGAGLPDMFYLETHGAYRMVGKRDGTVKLNVLTRESYLEGVANG